MLLHKTSQGTFPTPETKRTGFFFNLNQILGFFFYFLVHNGGCSAKSIVEKIDRKGNNHTCREKGL